MGIEELRENWDALGRDQPISAIISSLGSGDEEAFYASGEAEIAAVLETLRGLGLEPGGPALDFGCGVGRLTQALLAHFAEVVGLDIARSMIERARSANRYPDRCSYVLNERADLGIFPDRCFGFVYSSIVLQHVEPELTRGYLPELVRVLRPGGVLVLQLPAGLRPVEPLPDGAARARIAVAGDTATGTRSAAAGSRLALAVRVENVSPHTWEPRHHLSLGRRWLDARSGQVLVHADDGSHVRLLEAVHPGAVLDVAMSIPVPMSPGAYQLELDLSQPGEPLFGDQGSRPLLHGLTVVEGPSPPSSELRGGHAPARSLFARLRSRPSGGLASPRVAAAPGPLVAHLEMHGLARDEVVGFLSRDGAEIVAVLDDESAGPEWVSYRYVVQRP